MTDTLNYLFFYSYLAGMLWIAVGIWIIRFVIRNPSEDKLSQGGDMKGWAGGIALIIGGILIIIFKFLGKF